MEDVNKESRGKEFFFLKISARLNTDSGKAVRDGQYKYVNGNRCSKYLLRAGDAYTFRGAMATAALFDDASSVRLVRDDTYTVSRTPDSAVY